MDRQKKFIHLIPEIYKRSKTFRHTNRFTQKYFNLIKLKNNLSRLAKNYFGQFDSKIIKRIHSQKYFTKKIVLKFLNKKRSTFTLH